MSVVYDMEKLLETDAPLTKEQFENFDKYTNFTNDDKTAGDVDIEAAVKQRCKEIDEKKTYWW